MKEQGAADNSAPRGLGRGAFYVGLASVALNVLALALPLALLQIYDRIIPNSSLGTMLLLVAGVATAVILEGIMRVARAEIISWGGVQFEHSAGNTAFSRIMRAPLEDIERTGPGELIERLAGLPVVREVFSENWTLVVCDLPFVFLFLGTIYVLSGPLVLAPAAVLLLFLVFAGMGTALSGRAIKNFNEVRDRRQNFSIEVIQGVHSVKALAMESQMIQRYARLQEAVAKASHKVVNLNSHALALGNTFSQLATLSVVVVGGLMVVDNELTVGALSACMLLAGRAVQPVQKAVALWTRWQTARLMQRRFRSVFDIPEERRPSAPITAAIKGHIRLEDVRFHYPSEDEDLIRGVSMTVEPGSRVALTADNGAGKTTLLRLIHGSHKPTAGRILIDGIHIDQYDRDKLLQGGIAYVPQRGELLRGTILENMTMFRPELRKQALQIASELGLDGVVYRMAQGYYTRVGEGATDQLPRGVTQRISVVRALASSPRILLFDEANAAMDGPGDEMLRQYFERMDRDCTLVLVTLRPSLQKLADKLYRLDKGVLKAEALDRSAPALKQILPAPPPAEGEGGAIAERRPA